MGSTTITYALGALAVGLVCLVAGFLWGRSNLKWKLEQAAEEGHAALDAREFAMRQQLDEAIAEIARLRPVAEELERVQDRPKVEPSKYQSMKDDFDATLKAETAEMAAEPETLPQPPEPPAPESADEAIHRLLQSLETLNPPNAQLENEKIAVPEILEPAPESEPVPVADSSQVAVQLQAPEPHKPEPPKLEAALPQLNPPRPAPPSPARPAVAEAKAHPPQPKPGEALDEWQEFARSLAALTGRKQ